MTSTCAIGSTHWREKTDHLPPDAGRIGQRPEQVEDCARAELDRVGPTFFIAG